MKKIIPAIIFFLCSSSSFAQVQASLYLRNDSTFCLKPSVKGYPIKMKSGFGLLSQTLNTLYIFSDDAEFIDSVNFILTLKDKFKRVSYMYLFEADEHLVLLDVTKNYLLFFGKTGRLDFSIKLKKKYKGTLYFVNERIMGHIHSFFNDETSSFFIPIGPAKKRNGKEPFVDYNARKSLEHGYIGEFNMEGELIAVHGKYPAIYHKGEFSHLDGPLLDGLDGEIGHSQNLNHEITIQKIGTSALQTFGIKGGNIEKNEEDLPMILSRDESFLYETNRFIESYFYWSLNISDDYIFRTYTKSIKDTIQADPEDIAFLKKYLDGEIKGCMPTTRTEQRQAALLNKKPFYLQVYSRENKRLLMDEPIGFFRPYFLGSKENSVLFLEWENERYKVHRFDFNPINNKK